MRVVQSAIIEYIFANMEQYDLNHLLIFATIAELGSFSAAAKQLGLQKSKVSRAIHNLEMDVGGPLFYRTTRALSLTERGQRALACVSPGLTLLASSLRDLQTGYSDAKGTIRMTAVEDIGVEVIIPLVAKFSEQHPQVKFELNFSYDVKDLVKEGLDVAIRAGSTRHQSFRARTIGKVKFVFVASPRYLERQALSTDPRDLALLDQILWLQEGRRPQPVTMKRGSQTIKLTLTPKYLLNDSKSMLQLAKLGRGVAQLPEFMCETSIRSGELVKLYPTWDSYETPLTLITPAGQKATPLINKFISFIYDELAQTFPR